MSFMEAVRSCFSKYITVSGRAARSEFWYWTLFCVVASIILGAIDGMLGIGILGAIFSLGTILPSIAVGGRRLHDGNRTAWWLLLYLVPVIGWIVLLVFFIMKGTEGPNDHGEDPVSAPSFA